MTAEYLSSLAGIVLSLIFGYFPKLSGWYDGLDGAYKKLVMLGLLIVVAGGVLAIACTGNGELFGVAVVCDKAGLAAFLKVFVAALIANQGTYLITKS